MTVASVWDAWEGAREQAMERLRPLWEASDVCFPGGSEVKASACNVGDLSLIPGSGRSSEKGMATHSHILGWRIPWTEEPGVAIVHRGHKESD